MSNKTRHHVVPQSRGGGDERENILMVPGKKHEAYHLLFANALPEEAVEILINQWTSSEWKSQNIGNGAMIILRRGKNSQGYISRPIKLNGKGRRQIIDTLERILNEERVIIVCCSEEVCLKNKRGKKK